MQILLGILMGVAWILIVSILRSLTTLFHEFGHAIPSLIFTDGAVNVYIGTYGKKNEGLHFHLGRLNVYFKFNIFNWNIGMCSHQSVPEIWKSILIIIGGPIASLFFASPLIYYISQYDTNQIGMFIALAFIIAAIIDFLINIIPSNNPIYTQGGHATYNDGYSLYLLISRFSLSDEYLALEKEFNNNNFDELFKKGKIILARGNASKAIYELLILASIKEQELEDALFLYQEMGQKYKLNKNEHFQIGKIYQDLKKHREAISYFDKYIYYNYNDAVALTFRGISKAALGMKEGAMIDFESALNNDPENELALENKRILLH